MKSQFFVLKAVLLVFISFNSITLANTPPGGNIAMEDDIMMITTVNSSNGTISQIDIFDLSGNLIHSITGCGTTECTSNLSKLNTATYDVHVTTSTGYSFSDSIFVSS